jgi:hypothetical protein
MDSNLRHWTATDFRPTNPTNGMRMLSRAFSGEWLAHVQSGVNRRSNNGNQQRDFRTRMRSRTLKF